MMAAYLIHQQVWRAHVYLQYVVEEVVNWAKMNMTIITINFISVDYFFAGFFQWAQTSVYLPTVASYVVASARWRLFQNHPQSVVWPRQRLKSWCRCSTYRIISTNQGKTITIPYTGSDLLQISVCQCQQILSESYRKFIRNKCLKFWRYNVIILK